MSKSMTELAAMTLEQLERCLNDPATTPTELCRILDVTAKYGIGVPAKGLLKVVIETINDRHDKTTKEELIEEVSLAGEKWIEDDEEDNDG